ncbi:MAG: metal-dependent transcriptional regulator [Planctomycetes bacterium]|nr:metal-dependent transcriptional regulator [Planctomycetota bacterium]
MPAPSNISLVLLMLRLELESGSGPADIAAAALIERSGVAPSTMTGLLRAADASGLITWTARHGARLTAQGRREALRQLRRHRIVETYLATHLGIDWALVHDEAVRIDAAASDLLIERMDAAMGHPSHDPHGDPIPDAAGAMPPARACCRPDDGTPRSHGPLTALPVDRPLQIVHVLGNDTAFLQLLGRHGVRPGGRVRVAAGDAGSGTVTIAAADAPPLTLATGIARQVHACISVG